MISAFIFGHIVGLVGYFCFGISFPVGFDISSIGVVVLGYLVVFLKH